MHTIICLFIYVLSAFALRLWNDDTLQLLSWRLAYMHVWTFVSTAAVSA